MPRFLPIADVEPNRIATGGRKGPGMVHTLERVTKLREVSSASLLFDSPQLWFLSTLYLKNFSNKSGERLREFFL